MAVPVYSHRDHLGVARIQNLPNATDPQEPATLAQLNSAVEGLAQKDNVRVRAQANINLAAPGASIDGIAMGANDRFMAPLQTIGTENGLYVWNGAAVPATRSLDASTFDELESALVPVDEGTNAGTVWRQTVVNGVLGTNAPAFVQFGTSSAQATEASVGVAELATQAETNAGTDDLRIVTPLKLATSPFARRSHTSTFGDGSATSFAITHNLNSLDVAVQVRETGGNQRTVDCEVRRTSVNAVQIVTDVVPAAGALRALVTLNS